MCSFSWLSSIPLYMYHSFFIHSSVDGYLGCFHLLTIINSASTNIGVHVSHYPEPPPISLPSPILLGCPRTPTLSALHHASSQNCQSMSHMIIYMFQCYSLISSHLRLLPHSPKVCSLYLCLFCCLVYRIIITVFLN